MRTMITPENSTQTRNPDKTGYQLLKTWTAIYSSAPGTEKRYFADNFPHLSS